MGISKFTSKCFISLYALLGLFILSSNGIAQGNLHFGRLTVTPSIKYELNYNDNIFIDPTNEQDDFINIITPSTLLGYSGSRPGNYFQAGFNADFALYSDFSDNNWQRYNLFASGGYESPKGFYVKLSDNYTWSKDPFGSFNEFEQTSQFGLGQLTRRWDNQIDAVLGYHLSNKWFTEGSYRFFMIRYDFAEDKWQDRTDNRAGLAFFRRLTGKTSALIEYRWKDWNFNAQNNGIFDPGTNVAWSSDTSEDSTFNDLFLGVRFDNPGGKLNGEIKLGYGNRNWENSVDPQGFPYEDIGSWISETYVTYQPYQRTSLTLNFQRSLLGSSSAQESGFINTLIQLSLRQQLAYRLSLDLMGLFNNDDFQDEPTGLPSKYFNRYHARIGIDWAFKPWLTVGLEYLHVQQNVSDTLYDGSEFTVNNVAFRITGTY